MKIRIIPAADILSGQVVRLTQGDYARVKVYYKDPVEVAKRFEDCGLTRLHIVDLDGAKASSPANLRTLERVATATGLELQYGGGIKSRDALRSAFDAGAARVICGSVAVSRPEEFEAWFGEFGPERIILGADVREGKVAVKGWLEDSPLTIDALYARFPAVTQSICTDIARDGMLCGPSIALYQRLHEAYPGIEVTVSGGISSIDDIRALDEASLPSVIVGKAIYEGHITFNDLLRCSLSE